MIDGTHGSFDGNRRGRVRGPIHPRVRRILYGHVGAEDLARLRHFARLERAQLLMLNEAGLVPAEQAREILRAVDKLEEENFDFLAGREKTRGLYMLWERCLAVRAGSRGAAHLARSRNDFLSALTRLEFRDPSMALALGGVRLVRSIARRADRERETVCVVRTNHLPAAPTTFAHQLTAWAIAIQRDLRHLLYAIADLDVSPLGAGATAGTSLPIDPDRVARLLGFSACTANSIDAVASRDFALRLLSAASVMSITLSRIAAELLDLCAAIPALIRLPDALVGESSALPQKRNPFVLEHVRSRGSSATGVLVAATLAMQAAPFGNCISVNSEAMHGILPALQSVAESAELLRLVIDSMDVDAHSMQRLAVESLVALSAIAERMVIDQGMGVRDAHEAVGAVLREATESGEPSLALNQGIARLAVPGAKLLMWNDPATMARAAEFGGGPGTHSMDQQSQDLRTALREQTLDIRSRRRRYRCADHTLRREVQQLLRNFDT